MGIARFFRRAQHDREGRGEIESHIRIETDENVARGMSESKAPAAAQRKFGDARSIREEIYGMNTLALIDTVIRDVRYSLRSLRHNRAFAITAVVTLAVGIGANTAMFSVVNSILLKPLPYPDSERLVAVAHAAPGAAGLASVSGDLLLSESMYVTYAGYNRTFESFGIWTPGTATITGSAQPEQVRTVLVSDGALQALAVAPIAGRVFSQGDFAPGGPAVTILTHGYWQRRFGNDRSVVGRTIRIDSRPFVVAGIMPAGFRFIGQDADLVLPIVIDRAKLRLPGFGFHCVARLRPGVTMRRAAADLARLVPIWRDSWPGIDPHLYDSWHIAPVVRPLKQELTGSVGNILWIVMGTIGIVMLIVCANVANLQLVRAEGRSQELAVRSALGAGSGRLIRELLTESLLLALAGGALGIGLAFEGLRILVAIGPGQLPRLNEISLDWTALAYALAISITTGLVFGSMPAFRYARACLTLNLRSGGRNLSHGRERRRTRNILAIAQVAMALVLLISAGLAIRTFQALHRVQPGFTGAEQLQLVRTSIPQALVPERERVIRMWNDVLNRLRAIPGVSAAAFSSEMPMEGIPVDWDVILAEGQTMTAELPPLRVFELISPDLPRTMGMRLIAGRDYTWADVYGLRSDVIVSENLAREFWGTPSAALGKRLSTGLSSSLREVIGVFEDVRDNGVQKPAPAIVYWPAYSVDFYSRDGKPRVERTVTFAIRTARAGSQGLLRQIEQAVWSVNPSLPLADVRTMRDVYDRSLARPSFTLVMLAIASGIALMLGLIGIYGVISYAVTQRRREIGIRLALGARDREMRGMFVRYGLRIAAIGCVIGLVAAAAVTRAMRSLLFGISPLDPLIYAGVPLVLTIAVLAASYFPARRAASVDPVETLRAE